MVQIKVFKLRKRGIARNKAMIQSKIVEKSGYSKDCYVQEQTTGEFMCQCVAVECGKCGS